MKKLKVKEEISILDAVDRLSSLAEIDITLSSQDIDTRTFPSQRWLNPELMSQNEELVQETFEAIKRYLEQLVSKDSSHLKDPHIQKGIQAIMALTTEAVEKIEKFTDLFKEGPYAHKLADLREYQELCEYYASAILPYFPQVQDLEDTWEEQMGIQSEKLLEVQKKGLRDVEDVKEDQHYELFFLQKEDRKPFYDYDIIRRLKLLYDFDKIAIEGEGEDLVARCKILQDKEFHNKASEILKVSREQIHDFYKEALKHKENTLVSNLNKALMALMLGASTRNLLQHSSSEKGAIGYFHDFQYYLRRALHTPEYKKYVSSHAKGKDAFYQSLYVFIHKLCSCYFLTVTDQRETASFLRKIIQQGAELLPDTDKKKNQSLSNELLSDDMSIRAVLKSIPSGPITQIIEAFLQGDIKEGWDPLGQKNGACQIFTFAKEGKEVLCIRLPAPVKHKQIGSAECAEEFEGYLHALKEDLSPKRFMLVNLQDRTAWEEHARSVSLEHLCEKSEYTNTFFVIGLAKNTDFYFQRNEYEQLSDAEMFMHTLQEQLEGGKQCGYYLPKKVEEKVLAFTSKISSMVHTCFFGGKEKLSQQEREDFIEIFYFFFLLKCIESIDAHVMSLSCKDAIDTGACANAEFFSFLRLLVSDKPWKDEEKDFLLWILYAPALFLRHRAIHHKELTRIIHALSTFQKGMKEKDKLLKLYRQIYDAPWQEIEIKKAI